MKTVYLTLLCFSCSASLISTALADNGAAGGNTKTYESNGVLVTENYVGGQLSGVTKIVPQADGTKVQQFQPYAMGKVAGEPTYTQTTRDNRVARIAAPKENLLDKLGATSQPLGPTPSRGLPQPTMVQPARPQQIGQQPMMQQQRQAPMGQQQRPAGVPPQQMIQQQKPAGIQPGPQQQKPAGIQPGPQQQRPAGGQPGPQQQRSAGAPQQRQAGIQQQRSAQAPQGRAKPPRPNAAIPPNSR
jgi:hypothetical protein